MFMGHFATALVPYERLTARRKPDERPVPFWLLLAAAQILDFVMLFFVIVGFESFLPHEFHPFETKFYEMKTDMLYSHDIVPVFGWALIFAGFAFAISRRRDIAVWCFALVVIHEAMDLVVGFKHYVAGQGTAGLGLALYQNAPLIGLLIEALICAAIVLWFIKTRAQRGVEVSTRLKWVLYGVLVGGTAFTLPMAV